MRCMFWAYEPGRELIGGFLADGMDLVALFHEGKMAGDEDDDDDDDARLAI